MVKEYLQLALDCSAIWTGFQILLLAPPGSKYPSCKFSYSLGHHWLSLVHVGSKYSQSSGVLKITLWNWKFSRRWQRQAVGTASDQDVPGSADLPSANPVHSFAWQGEVGRRVALPLLFVSYAGWILSRLSRCSLSPPNFLAFPASHSMG